ncbi:glycosyl hydrolase 108 family protein [Salinimicrobium sp. 3283s]|uniref:glycoside hydrolase family 108 protein n=1 Tax=Salinimicrobium sp. 3283s TaxID=3114359 RepID=UPI0031E93131
MTPNFKKAFVELIGIEGGYVNDPTDRGGETKYGISKRSYPHLDIRNLTLQQAEEIYYRDFWKVNGLDNIVKYELALELFDTGVNMGVGVAPRFLQEALNLMNRNQRDFADLKVDGKIGPVSIAAYKKVDDRILLKVLNGLQFRRYVEICERDPAQEKYFNGWMKRV